MENIKYLIDDNKELQASCCSDDMIYLMWSQNWCVASLVCYMESNRKINKKMN